MLIDELMQTIWYQLKKRCWFSLAKWLSSSVLEDNHNIYVQVIFPICGGVGPKPQVWEKASHMRAKALTHSHTCGGQPYRGENVLPVKFRRDIVRVGGSYRVAIPREIMEALHLKVHDKVEISLTDGETAILIRPAQEEEVKEDG